MLQLVIWCVSSCENHFQLNVIYHLPQQTTTTSEGTSTTTITGQKQFSARETLVFIRLVRWGLQSLDIYTLAAPRAPAQPPAQPHVRSKEEKEVLEHFSGVVRI